MAAIEDRIGSVIDEAFTVPGGRGPARATSSPTPATQASNGAVWEPRLSEGRAIELRASSEVVRTGSLVLTGVAVAAGLAAVALAIGVPVARRRRRRQIRPRGRHGAPVDTADL